MNRLRRHRNNNNYHNNYEYVLNDDERFAINYYTNIKTTASTTKDGLSGIISIFFSNISSFFSLSDN